jgi:hypothetical protein
MHNDDNFKYVSDIFCTYAMFRFSYVCSKFEPLLPRLINYFINSCFRKRKVAQHFVSSFRGKKYAKLYESVRKYEKHRSFAISLLIVSFLASFARQ